jgi:hypothetical protein
MHRVVKRIVFVTWMSVGASAVAGAHTSLDGMPAMFAADESMWKRVQRFDVGTRVKLTVAGAPVVERYFVLLNDTEVILLNLTAVDLPKRQLLSMAADNPAWIAGTAKTTYRDSDLRLGPDGVFLKDKKLADLSQVVERIPRNRVTSITKA